MKKFFLSSLVVSLFLTASASAARPVRGSYDVPVLGQDNQSFPVKFKSEEYDGNPVSVEFPLPIELTGHETLVTLAQSPTTPEIWSGPQVNATCEIENRWFVCQMKFHDLSISQEQSHQIIKERYADPAEMQRVLEAVKQFSSEGIGILRYKLRGSAR